MADGDDDLLSRYLPLDGDKVMARYYGPTEGDTSSLDTSHILARIPKSNPVVGLLRAARDRIPENRDHHVSMLNMIRGGLDTASNWLDYRNKLSPSDYSPSDTLAPLGAGFMGSMFAPQNALGIFGGRLAKTADHAALARAEEMAAKGADRKAIWDQTGWFQGADGKWRFEIDDSASKWLAPGPNEIMPGKQVKGSMDFMLQHPGVAENYPDVMSRPVQYFKPSEVKGPMAAGHYSPTQDAFAIRAFDPSVGGNPHSTALHEIQHAIQQREGFALGTNPNHEARSATSTNPIIQQMRDEFARKIFDEPGFRGSKEAIDEWERILRLERLDVAHIGEQKYYDNLGEREARNVQSRMKMAPDERKARPPWETEDAPRIK